MTEGSKPRTLKVGAATDELKQTIKANENVRFELYSGGVGQFYTTGKDGKETLLPLLPSMDDKGNKTKLSEEDKDIVSEAIEMVGIGSLAQRTIDTLSDGERQKAMIAKALAQQTPIILLDEPTAFLDFHSKVSTLRLMLRLAHETNKTILLSTHDVEMAIQLSNVLWIVQDGKIQAGTTESLTKDGILQSFLQADGITYDEKEHLLKIED